MCLNFRSFTRFNENDSVSLIPQESVEHALVEADGEEPVFYAELSFDHPDYDVTSSEPDEEYLQKVFNIANGNYKQLPITERVLEIYGMRHRTEWQGADTSYDAWLLCINIRRSWFPYQTFIEMFPRWEEKRKQIFELENPVEFVLSKEKKQLPDAKAIFKNEPKITPGEKFNVEAYFKNSPVVKSSSGNKKRIDSDDEEKETVEGEDDQSFEKIKAPKRKKRKIEEISDEEEDLEIKLEYLLPSYH